MFVCVCVGVRAQEKGWLVSEESTQHCLRRTGGEKGAAALQQHWVCVSRWYLRAEEKGSGQFGSPVLSLELTGS